MANGIRLVTDGGVATITLECPDVGNAIDIPMERGLMEATITCEENPSVHCLVLSGSGRLFCAGGDVAAFAAAGEDLPAYLRAITAYLHAAIIRLLRMPKPVICAVNGPAAGAGIGLGLLGDIVIAEPSAHMTLAYTGLGMSPDAGATWLLPRLVGLRRAQELCLRNTRVAAVQAAEIGLITRVAEEGKPL